MSESDVTRTPGTTPFWKAVLSGKFVLLGAAILTSVGFLIWTSTQGATVYYHTVAEVKTMGDDAYNRLIRVNGIVVDNSITFPGGDSPITFSIKDDSGQLSVEFKGTPPDLFGYSTDDRYQEVLVEGQLKPSGIFHARSLIVKHGPEFEPREIPSR